MIEEESKISLDIDKMKPPIVTSNAEIVELFLEVLKWAQTIEQVPGQIYSVKKLTDWIKHQTTQYNQNRIPHEDQDNPEIDPKSQTTFPENYTPNRFVFTRSSVSRETQVYDDHPLTHSEQEEMLKQLEMTSNAFFTEQFDSSEINFENGISFPNIKYTNDEEIEGGSYDGGKSIRVRHHVTVDNPSENQISKILKSFTLDKTQYSFKLTSPVKDLNKRMIFFIRDSYDLDGLDGSLIKFRLVKKGDKKIQSNACRVEIHIDKQSFDMTFIKYSYASKIPTLQETRDFINWLLSGISLI